ncbi:hypothetical protein [Indiicoccus explosivorum]|uniref:hypothetical protein n=1 Tax=Indiicoccus explosivorum TaxID=1917864 RepID=UPI000B4366FC|nr:hypothetical protein [Indiicoccus explosivorum]
MRIMAASFIILLLTGCSAGENAVIEQETEAEQTNTDLTGLPEYAALSEEIDLNLYSAEIESDDDKNRIIFFSDETGDRVYKSNYTKSSQQLDITELADGDRIFSKVLDP